MIGRTINGYKITALLGEGGMAKVYQAEHLVLHQSFAMKVFNFDSSSLRPNQVMEFAQRFKREIDILVEHKHSNIVRIIDHGSASNMQYLVMELLPGGTLTDRIRQGALSVEESATILDQVASALDYMHGKNIFHRDMKPPNILFNSAGQAVLTDFGIAKVLGETTEITESHQILGSLSYCSPEQWQTKNVDRRADIYSLGIVLFEMLTGNLPFQGRSPHAMMDQHLNKRPPAIIDVRPDLSPEIGWVINKVLEKHPDDRFQSAGEFAAEFRKAAEIK